MPCLPNSSFSRPVGWSKLDMDRLAEQEKGDRSWAMHLLATALKLRVPKQFKEPSTLLLSLPFTWAKSTWLSIPYPLLLNTSCRGSLIDAKPKDCLVLVVTWPPRRWFTTPSFLNIFRWMNWCVSPISFASGRCCDGFLGMLGCRWLLRDP